MIGEDRHLTWIRSGQARAYQDTVREFDFDAKGADDALEFITTEYKGKYNLNTRDDSANHNGHCHFPYGLGCYFSIRKVSEGRYKFLLTEPFTD